MTLEEIQFGAMLLTSWLLSLSVLNLQRRGHLRARERYFGLGCWAAAVAILGCGTLAGGGECGFTDRSYFQRRFKEQTGRTPAEWRVPGR